MFFVGLLGLGLSIERLNKPSVLMYTAEFVQVNHISHHPLEVPIRSRYRRTLMYIFNNMVACTPLNLATLHQPETSHLIWEFANFQNIIFSINFLSGLLPTRYRFYWLQSRNPIIFKNICAMHRQQKFTFAASLARLNHFFVWQQTRTKIWLIGRSNTGQNPKGLGICCIEVLIAVDTYETVTPLS